MAEEWQTKPPKGLVEHHEGIKRSKAILMKQESPGPDLLDALFSPENEPIMRKVWQKLAKLNQVPVDKTWQQRNPLGAKRAAVEESFFKYEEACFDFYRACRDSLGLYTKTPGERKKELLDISAKAAELAELIGQSEIAWTSVLYYIRDELQDVQYPNEVHIPRIEELLLDVAEEAKQLSERPHKHQIVKKINRQKDGSIPLETYRIGFVRKMTRFMRNHYDTPAFELVANITTVLLGIVTDAQYVKSTCR